MNDDVSRLHENRRRLVAANSLKDDASFRLRVGQPSFDDDRLWFGRKRRQSFDDYFSGRRRQTFSANRDHLLSHFNIHASYNYKSCYLPSNNNQHSYMVICQNFKLLYVLLALAAFVVCYHN